MTNLDHRILIPSPPQIVWEHISNLEHNPQWQADCEGVVFLSQKRKGVGTRWRQRSSNRQEFVYEISTWYDGLGYEYILIDGAPFKEVRGRVRLQEIPEGTIVQWTLTYELGGGVLGGLRNALSTERRQESIMVDSLKELWKQARRMGSMTGYESRALMRDGVQDAESRANYRSSRATVAPSQPTQDANEPKEASTSAIPEPPLSEEDTRPRPSVVNAETLPSHEQGPSPDVNETTPIREEHARFAPPPPVTNTPEPAQEQPRQDVTSFSDSMESYRQPPPPEHETQTTTATTTEDETLPSRGTPPDSPTTQDELKPTTPPSQDTSEVSIWEVFGIPSPTDSQKMRAIQVAEEAQAEYEAEQADITPNTPSTVLPPSNAVVGRSGARIRARRRLIRVRRPGE